MTTARIAILGGGMAGLGAAWQLVRRGKAEAILLERHDAVGGIAGSFELHGIDVDYGSHRLHPACQPFILEDIRTLLKNDLLTRYRNGRIRLRGHWIHFPLRPADLVMHLPWSFGLEVARDALLRRSRGRSSGGADTFASVLERGLGRTICRDFYFPYARKIWGVQPNELSAIQAHRRVSTRSLGEVVKKLAGLVSGPSEVGRFYYPRRGFGQISRAIAAAARDNGAEIHLGTTVRGVHLGPPHRIEVEHAGDIRTMEVDTIWSTIPVTNLVRLLHPSPASEVLEAGRCIDYRAMVLVYLVLAQPHNLRRSLFPGG